MWVLPLSGLVFYGCLQEAMEDHPTEYERHKPTALLAQCDDTTLCLWFTWAFFCLEKHVLYLGEWCK